MKRFVLALVAIGAVGLGTVSISGQGGPRGLPACDPDNGGLKLPAGFCALVVYPGNGESGRHILVTPNGDIFISLRDVGQHPGGILALRDTSGDGKTDVTERFGAHGATGLVMRNGYLYYATNTTIERFKMTPGELKPAGPAEVIVSGMRGESGGHRDKDIAFDDAGNVYVNIGLPSNACAQMVPNAVAPDPCPLLTDGGGIWRFKADVVGQAYAPAARYATGMRQPVALAWHNGKLWAAMNSRDSLNTLYPTKFTDEDNAVRPLEPLLEISEGDVYGWPYCWLDGKTNTMILAPEYGGDGQAVGRCAQYKQPVAAFPAHYAPVALTPYTGSQFPAHYRGGLFMAAHGSHNRTPLPQDGYNVVFQPFANGKPSGKYEIFADGFKGKDPLMSPADAVARPDGVAQGPDGSLYITESVKGKIWRVIYRGANQAAAAVPSVAPATYTAPPTAEPVIYSSKDAITTSFEKRTLMLHDSQGSYMVETAQRDAPGGAEVHLMDTDVTYIIKGSATIVTGGTVVDINPHPASRPGNPHPEYEIRGARIAGGETHHLSAGDSIVIPKGVPHWFSEVEPPFWYFNVKVR